MKAIVSLVLILISSFSYCQSSCQIADSLKKWNTVYGGFAAMGIAHCGGTLTHKLEGEETIGGTTYLKVWESTDSLNTEWIQKGDLREDTIAKQVFYAIAGQGEGLLYDFSLQVGDSITIDNLFTGGLGGMFDCGEIDTVFLNGEPRKRFTFYPHGSTYWVADTWIEGIGSLRGLLYSGLAPAGGFTKLLCCSHNDTLQYIDSSFNNCYVSEFYPKITTLSIDTAYVDTYFEFQLQHSASFTDSISWVQIYSALPSLQLDEATGILHGIVTSSGSYLIGIAVRNNKLDLLTDILQTTIVVSLPTSITDQQKLPGIQLYPNPCNTRLVISIIDPTYKDFNVEIINATGNSIKRIYLHDETTTIDCGAFQRGIYLFKFSDPKKGFVKFEKVLLN